MENVPHINSFEKMLYWNPFSSNPRRREIRKKSLNRRFGDRFFSLTQLAHDTHQTLVEKGSPLRFCIYKNDGDMSMDVIVMDKAYKESKIFTRSIKNETFKTLVKSIHNQIGLVLDHSV